MRHSKTGQMRPNRLSYAVSLAVMSLVASNAAVAQQGPANGAAADATPTATVLVVGTRASQQSSIDRKKNAATAQDSIVAEDVGSLPDRNVGEAISRMAGIVLDRGDFGEGVSVSVRGNSADLTRIELDGQGVQAAGGTDQNGGGNGRGVELRQLPADLIKSVDVVKGSTADMTEGSLGGGIIIKTRTGLDFKKPYASLRLGATQLSLDKKWTPDLNLVLSNKFLDNRLGLMMNVSSTTLNNESHSQQVSQTAQQGYYRLLDFDDSLEKTYTYNPSTVNKTDIAAISPVVRTPMAGGGFFDSATPFDIVSKSAAAKTKQDCYNAFPALTPAQVTAIGVAANSNAANSQRGTELLSCLNQWSDYTPSNVRYFIKKERDRKQNLDLRADFKVNNNLTLYTKGSFNRRDDQIEQLTYGLGNITVNPSSTIQPNYTGTTFTNNTTTNQRSPVPGSGYYLYGSTPSFMSSAYPINGTVVNIDPASVVVDASHHLTKYTITDGVAVPDQIIERSYTSGQYVQAGGTWKSGGLNVEFFVGDAKSEFRRAQERVSFAQYYGKATLQMTPTGLWNYSFPDGNFDQANPAGYARVMAPTANINPAPLSPTNNLATPGYTIAQQPYNTTSSTRTEVFWSPQIRESDERTAKLDLTYALKEIPFFTRIKAGFNLRDMESNAWAPGDSNAGGNSAGKTLKAPIGTFGTAGYVPGVYLPTPISRTVVNGCTNTPGSLGPGGAACKYGYNQGPNPLLGFDGRIVLTQQQFQDLVTQTLISPATSGSFFSGASNRAPGLLDNWMGIDIMKLNGLLNIPNQTYDCVKQCMASDGKIYDQPVNKVKETTQSFYVMSDFSFDRIPFTKTSLPFGLELEGNLGYRYVRNTIHGTGSMTFTSKTRLPGFDPDNPDVPNTFKTESVIQNAVVDTKTTDFLPIYNLAMWVVPDKVVVRYNRAKTVARPAVNRLLPSGSCTFDNRFNDNGVVQQSCSGTIGNPDLKARVNVNQNLSVEYYPNKDTMFTIAGLKQEGKVGEPITAGVPKGSLFSGAALIDPITGVNLSAVPFDYTTWVNGPVSTRYGFEASTKTAFTFLPSFLRYTGFDANFTRVHSGMAGAAIVDLITGDVLPPARESRTQYNVALWYDDGRLSARLALQGASEWFTCIAGCGQNNNIKNYPSQGVIAFAGNPFYSPGSPNFKDKTRYIDGKISYKIKPGVEVFIDGRNLGNVTTTLSQSHYAPISDGIPNLLEYAYAGRRITIGVNFRTL